MDNDLISMVRIKQRDLLMGSIVEGKASPKCFHRFCVSKPVEEVERELE